MYQKGELQVLTLACEDAQRNEFGCFIDGHIHSLYDSNDGGECSIPCVALRHSCGSWVIGGPDQIRALIADLEVALSGMS